MELERSMLYVWLSGAREQAAGMLQARQAHTAISPARHSKRLLFAGLSAGAATRERPSNVFPSAYTVCVYTVQLQAKVSLPDEPVMRLYTARCLGIHIKVYRL